MYIDVTYFSITINCFVLLSMGSRQNLEIFEKTLEAL